MVAFGFLSHNFVRWWGPTNDTLSFFNGHVILRSLITPLMVIHFTAISFYDQITTRVQEFQRCVLGADPGISRGWENHKRSGGSKGGARDVRPPSPRSKFFQCHAVLGGNLAKSYDGATLEGWRPHLGEILDPSLKGDSQLLIWPIFPPNCMKMKKI